MFATRHLTAADLYQTLKNIKVGGQFCQYSLKKCEELVPLINEINDLKVRQNAVILAHTYVTPEILYGVADHVGDSYGLSKEAMASQADKIVFVAVRFMGETAKILNPHKEVYVPARDAGCTLADSITAADVRRLRREFSDHTFVCYINTTAEVKAECDVCVTSANVVDIVSRMPQEKIYFLPDKMMGQNLISELQQRGMQKDIRYYDGVCEVHRTYSLDDVHKVQTEYPDAKVVSHPECQPEVCAASDYVGSTSQMLDYMRHSRARQFLMLTECGLSSRLQVEFPEKQLVGTCTLCDFMKSNSLEDVRRVLRDPSERDRVWVDPAIQGRALKCIEAMFHYAELSSPSAQ